MKKSRKLISLVLSLLMLMSVFSVGAVSADAAAGDTVYFKNTAGWSNVSCYMWKKGTEENNGAWPGQSMAAVGDGVYSYTVPDDKFDMVIFNGNGGSSQTDNLDYPGDNYIYDYSTKQWSVYDTSSVAPVISSSKKDGASFKTDTMDVTITASFADSAYYSVDGGASVSFSGSAVVTVGSGVAVGGTTTVTVVASNANGTATQTYTYTKKDSSAPVDDGSTSPALGGYYGTNPGGKVGAKKTISVDGDKSDWDSSMLISQGVANDDPRVYCHWSMHEIAVDDYAMYAAWDDDNLYLMYEMANVQDIVARQDDFPLSQGNLWIYNLPVFLYIYTGEGNITHGTTSSGTLWNSGITLDSNVDHVIAYSTNASNGPFVYSADDDGNIGDEKLKGSAAGMQIKWGNGKTLSGTLYGINAAGTDQGRVAGDTLDESSNWVDFYSLGHDSKLDMFYEVSIPLSSLDITASDIENSGIGIMKVSTFGTSGMDCQPYDMSMCDNANEQYSMDESTSHEKEDEDNITVPLARIGQPLSTGGTVVTTPTTPTAAPATTAPASGTTPVATAAPTETQQQDATVTTEPADTTPTTSQAPTESNPTEPMSNTQQTDVTESTASTEPGGTGGITPTESIGTTVPSETAGMTTTESTAATDPGSTQPTNPTVTDPTESTKATQPATSAKPKTTVKKAKKANPMTVSVKTKTVKAKKLKKAKQTVKAITVSKAKGKVSYAKIKSGTTKKIFKKVTIGKNGKITLKKGKYKKGTYKIKVKITAKGNSSYKSKSRTVTVRIKVK